MPVTKKQQRVNMQPVNLIRARNDSEYRIGPLPFDGDDYIFEPGEEIVVLEGAFQHWTGIPKPEQAQQQMEQHRLKKRWGKLKLATPIMPDGSDGVPKTVFPFPLTRVAVEPTKNTVRIGNTILVPTTPAEIDEMDKLRKRVQELEATRGVKKPEPAAEPEPEKAPAADPNPEPDSKPDPDNPFGSEKPDASKDKPKDNKKSGRK